MAKTSDYPTINSISDEEKFLIGRTLETHAVTYGTLKTDYSSEKLDVYQGKSNANKILRVNADGYIEPF